MKRKLTGLAVVLAACVALAQPASGANPDPGFVDFGSIVPSAEGGEFVEVRIGSNLIGLVSRLARQAEPEVAALIGNVRSIRVTVVGLGEDNREQVTTRVRRLRDELASGGWERVVTVQQKTEDVAVYVKLRGDEAVEGIVVTVLEGNRQAVLVNVAGDVRPEQVAELGERFNLEPLKKVGQAVNKS
jgi:hypothetical protein